MNIKKCTLIVMAIIGVVSKTIFCMEAEYQEDKTIDFPKEVRAVTLGSYCNNIAYMVPGTIHMDSFNKNFPPKTFDYDASLISFDTFSSYLALVTTDNKIKIIDTITSTVKEFPEQIDQKYTALCCSIGGNECIVGSDKGTLWYLKYNESPKLLENFSAIQIAPRSSVYKCKVGVCDMRGSLYATAMNDQWTGGHMFAGDIKTTAKGWSDGTSAVSDVCFSRDGSLVAFCANNYVMVYVTALLEKYKKVLRENNNIASSEPVRELCKAMKKAAVVYGKLYVDVVKKVVFHDDNEHVFAGLNSGKVYCSEMNEKGQSKEVVDFGENIASLAYSNGKLAVASLKKATLYFLSETNK